MKTPPPTGSNYPNDSAAGISDLLRVVASGSGKPPPPPRLPPAPPAAMDDDENLRRQSLDALCKAMLTSEEQTSALKDAMDNLDEKVATAIDDRMTVNIERLETVLNREGGVQAVVPTCEASGVRYLVHIYGLIILGTVFIGIVFILLRR